MLLVWGPTLRTVPIHLWWSPKMTDTAGQEKAMSRACGVSGRSSLELKCPPKGQGVNVWSPAWRYWEVEET